jgi:hypothetical protein
VPTSSNLKKVLPIASRPPPRAQPDGFRSINEVGLYRRSALLCSGGLIYAVSMARVFQYCSETQVCRKALKGNANINRGASVFTETALDPLTRSCYILFQENINHFAASCMMGTYVQPISKSGRASGDIKNGVQRGIATLGNIGTTACQLPLY